MTNAERRAIITLVAEKRYRNTKRRWCGSMAEQLICNQQVVGSTPITSSIMGDFPSGQRGQTVNLLSLTSVVRIHHPPPTKTEHLSTDKCSVFVYPSRRLGISSPHNARCISSAPLGLYLITRQRASYLRLDEIQHFVLMIYRNKLRMIYKASP